MQLYMDVCCLNRPFDDLTQDRIYLDIAKMENGHSSQVE